MILPSKELLSEVLDIEIETILPYLRDEPNIIRFYSVEEYFKDFGESEISTINIYELQHLMKEWALEHKKYVIINSGITRKGGFALIGFTSKEFHATTEFEAVVQACQWILDNKDKQ